MYVCICIYIYIYTHYDEGPEVDAPEEDGAKGKQMEEA